VELRADPAPLVSFLDLNPPQSDFLRAVARGLARKRKSIPCKFFYDEHGSRLFNQICELEEYYPTTTEIAILEEHVGEIAELVGRSAHLVELGSGASVKIRILLNALTDLAQYTAVDISRDHLIESASALARDYPNLDVAAVCADYTKEFQVENPMRKKARRNVAFFPGSTIGNFTPNEARKFLFKLSKSLGKDSGLLVGVDLKKDASIIYAAYNDAAGVTSEFNLNLLTRINRELNANFDLTAFRHEASYTKRTGRLRMELVSLKKQIVRIDNQDFDFVKGETIHTENSYKYSISDFRNLCSTVGYTPVACWTDSNSLFSVHYFTAQ